MALISAKTIITSLSLFHVTLAFFFLTDPVTIADQTLVYVLGEAMGMPHARSFENKSPALAFLAAVLGMMGISDLVTLSMPQDIWVDHHWGTQAPARLFICLVFVIYTFAFGPSSPIYGGSRGGRFSHPSAHTHNPNYTPSTWGGDGLKNRVFLTFAFLEMLTWFWVWITLREEQEEIARQRVKKRGAQSHEY
ncbi:uncharacterized protein CTRU02_204902 [Colletotrichum truncatum]|uniref:Uncharacterized protein n=1 Tax=Colletotrichum truncatum TaxID=5467 RepID=A0ACC3Z2G3_COLTU|nr:uncharacterized protein CTRU02_14039 [Colletotrichum truncatum]KAF6782720.1 hypothetical protein CTRU02_14039 [Colletotrichum truncatum]